MKNYWDGYYKNKKNLLLPSNFAKFIKKKKYLNKEKIVIELGCGDGRDTFFFSQNVKKIIAFDKSKEVIIKNNLIKKYKKIKNIKFCKGDIKQKFIYDQINKINFSIIYARFFIHSIDEKLENRLLKNLSLLKRKNVLIFFEFRTNKDKLMKKGKKISTYERFTDHYRRFINVNNFKIKIQKLNFNIIYLKQGINFSKFKNDNPHICRLIIKKK